MRRKVLEALIRQDAREIGCVSEHTLRLLLDNRFSYNRALDIIREEIKSVKNEK